MRSLKNAGPVETPTPVDPHGPTLTDMSSTPPGAAVRGSSVRPPVAVTPHGGFAGSEGDSGEDSAKKVPTVPDLPNSVRQARALEPTPEPPAPAAREPTVSFDPYHLQKPDVPQDPRGGWSSAALPRLSPRQLNETLPRGVANEVTPVGMPSVDDLRRTRSITPTSTAVAERKPVWPYVVVTAAALAIIAVMLPRACAEPPVARTEAQPNRPPATTASPARPVSGAVGERRQIRAALPEVDRRAAQPQAQLAAPPPAAAAAGESAALAPVSGAPHRIRGRGQAAKASSDSELSPPPAAQEGPSSDHPVPPPAPTHVESFSLAPR